MLEIRNADIAGLRPAGSINYQSTIDTYPSFIPTFKATEISLKSRTSAIEQWFESAQAPRCILVAYEDNTPIGYSACCQDIFAGFQAALNSFHILPNRRGQGIGSQLFASTVSWLVQAGVSSLYLEAYQANPFQHFYQKMGGKIIANFKQHRYGSQMDVVVYGWADLTSIASPSNTPLSHA